MFADQLLGRMLSAPDGVQKAWHGIAGLQNGFLQSLGVLLDHSSMHGLMEITPDVRRRS